MSHQTCYAYSCVHTSILCQNSHCIGNAEDVSLNCFSLKFTWGKMIIGRVWEMGEEKRKQPSYISVSKSPESFTFKTSHSFSDKIQTLSLDISFFMVQHSFPLKLLWWMGTLCCKVIPKPAIFKTWNVISYSSHMFLWWDGHAPIFSIADLELTHN